MPTPLLSVRNLHVSFSREGKWTEAVHGIDLDVMAGRTLGLVGESGSGKSVSSLAVMRLLNDKISRISADSVVIGGDEIKDYTEHQMADVRGKRIAMIFQEPMTSLNPVYKCGYQVSEMILQHEGRQAVHRYARPAAHVIDSVECIAFPTEERGSVSMGSRTRYDMHGKVGKDALPIGRHDIHKKVKQYVIELFKQVMLPRPEAIYDSYPHELSGGQKQRVMIAMAIACHPHGYDLHHPRPRRGGRDRRRRRRDAQRRDPGARHGKRHPQPPTASLHTRPPRLPSAHRRAPQAPAHRQGVPRRRVARRQGEAQILHDLQITDEERRAHLKQLYSREPLLKVEHLQTWYPLRKGVFSRVYGHVKAVDDVSLEVYEGETLGLVGESGCGKTTLGRSILRLAEPTGGKVWFDGIEVTALKGQALRDFRKQAQIVFQDPYSSLNPRLTIGEAIAEPMLVHGIEKDRKKSRAIVCDLLEQVGLKAEHYDRYPHEFSGGQRQRICIARALAVNPRLVICDESVSALDVSVQAQVLNLLNRLKEERHLTYIFISHDQMDDADQLFEHPQNGYTKKLIAALPGRGKGN